MENNFKNIENIVYKLRQIDVIEKKDILNLKVITLKKLYTEKKITFKDLIAIWELQEILMSDDLLKMLFKDKK